ncbi:outer membrane beta-barrel protein [Nitrospira sp. Nam80]
MTRIGRLLFVCCLFTAYPERQALAEWYVAGQVGVNFADRLTDISGTGNLSGFRAPDFDLKNAVLYGAKVGVFPGNGWFGVELDAFNSQPNIKNLDDVPGIHMRVTNVGVNVIARYPGVTFQPYVGIGTGALIARIGDSATTKADTDVASVLNLLAGIRAFVTPYTAVFTEYKYSQSTFDFAGAFPPGGGFSGNYHAQQLVFGVSYHF